MTEPTVMRVGSETAAPALAKAISAALHHDEVPALDCVGPHAVNQAVKAVAIARGAAAAHGVLLMIAPSFRDIPVRPGQDRADNTCMRLVVVARDDY